MRHRFLFALGLMFMFASQTFAQTNTAPRFNTRFEGASLGKIVAVNENEFRCALVGQYDERGRNRQVSWFYFRLDNVAKRPLTLTFTELEGEYNDKPGSVSTDKEDQPVISYDQQTWHYQTNTSWNTEAKEMTLRFTPEQDTVWVALLVPYTHSKLLKLLDEVDHSPHATVEVFGRTVQGRDLHLVTVTNPDIPNAQKKTVWLQARQHAWETGTSFTMEGALRWVISDDPVAKELRDKVIFKFTPMLDPDGCATGQVRFNANGYDVNRHWNKVDLQHKEFLKLMPEIWYAKKTILAHHAQYPIAVMVNLHNTKTEYIDTQASDEASQAMFQKLFDNLQAKTLFDPTRKLGIRLQTSGDANSMYHDAKVPVALMELRTLKGPKLGRYTTHEDRLKYGAQLIRVMAETVVE
ncbi:MAG TPA: M14-type cytosolic carboxypeptidase [Verrucomicrobiae bacterium]